MNQVVLAGKIAEIKIKKLEDKTVLILAVSRPYKNEYGEYDIDKIPCVVVQNLAKQVNEYCYVGDTVGIKGTLCCEDSKNIQLTVEKVTTLRQDRKDK